MATSKNYLQPSSNTVCPYCGEKTPIKEIMDYRSFYAFCAHCQKKFVVEPVRGDIKVFTLEKVPYGSDPDCQCLERGQGNEE